MSDTPRSFHRHAHWLALAVSGVCVLLLAWLAPVAIKGIDERAGDWAWRWGSTAQEERRLLIVDIDEASVARLGPWPWPRARMADLVRRLNALGAGGIALDVAFPEPRADDAGLAAALAASPAAVAQIFALDGTAVASGQLQGALEAPGCRPPLPAASGYIANAPALRAAAGHIVPRIDPDGSVRRLPGLICFEGRAYPTLGQAMLLRAAEAAPALELQAGQGWLDAPWRLVHPGLPGITIPLDGDGDVRLSYRRKRGAFISVSASDVLEGRAPAHLFRGAWVLVGATAFGIADAVPTPHGGAVGGIEVHAQFVSALLDGRLPYAPQGARLFQLCFAALVAGLLLATARACGGGGRRALLPAWTLPFLGIGLAALALVLHALALLHYDLWIGWAVPAAFALLASLLLAVIEHTRTRFERERLYRNLAAYLPAPVAARIALQEVSGVIEAERREVTVLFADIRNFSAYCEGRPPEEAATLLHAFFSTAARVIEANHGVVEEFVGDSIMGLWNAPQPCADHPRHALAAARQLHEECRALFPDVAPPGLEPLALGVGIETGDALVGSFGPARRRMHGALGETVTIAARLTALTGDLAHPLLIGEKAAARLNPAESGVALMPLGSFLLDGLRCAHKIYALAPPAAAD